MYIVIDHFMILHLPMIIIDTSGIMVAFALAQKLIKYFRSEDRVHVTSMLTHVYTGEVSCIR